MPPPSSPMPPTFSAVSTFQPKLPAFAVISYLYPASFHLSRTNERRPPSKPWQTPALGDPLPPLSLLVLNPPPSISLTPASASARRSPSFSSPSKPWQKQEALLPPLPAAIFRPKLPPFHLIPPSGLLPSSSYLQTPDALPSTVAAVVGREGVLVTGLEWVDDSSRFYKWFLSRDDFDLSVFISRLRLSQSFSYSISHLCALSPATVCSGKLP